MKRIYTEIPKFKYPGEGLVFVFDNFSDCIKKFETLSSLLSSLRYLETTSTQIKVYSGYFYKFRGSLYNKPTIQDAVKCLATDLIMSPLHPFQDIILREKKNFSRKFKNANVFDIEFGQPPCSYITINVGSVDGRPIVTGDKVILFHKDAISKNEIDNTLQIYYGLILIIEGSGKHYPFPIELIEPLIKVKEIDVINELEAIDFDKYMDSFLITERTQKLKKIEKKLKKN